MQEPAGASWGYILRQSSIEAMMMTEGMLDEK